MKTSTTTNSELFKNKVKATASNELKSLVYWAHLHLLSNCVLDLIQSMFFPGVRWMWTLPVLVFWWVGSFTMSRWLSPGRGVTAWILRMPALTMGSGPGSWLQSGPRSWPSVWGAGWRFSPPGWWLPILQVWSLGPLQMWWGSLRPGVQTAPWSWSMSASIIPSWRFRSTLSIILLLQNMGSRSRLWMFTLGMGWRSRSVSLHEGWRLGKFLHLSLQWNLLLIWGLTVTAQTAWWWWWWWWWWWIFRLWLHCLLCRLFQFERRPIWTLTSWALGQFVDLSTAWICRILYRLFQLWRRLGWTLTSWTSRWLVYPSVTRTIRIIFGFGFLWILLSVNRCNISSFLTALTLTQTKVLKVVIGRFDPLGWWVLLLLGMASRSFRLQFGQFAVILVDFTIITLVCFFSFCSSSFPDVNNLGFPFFLNAFEDLALMCGFLFLWWIWPHL